MSTRSGVGGGAAMQMDFFDHQDRARKSSGRLVLLFILGVLGTIAAAYTIVVVGIMFLAGRAEDGTVDAAAIILNPVLMVLVAGGVLVVVGGGTAYKLAQLSSGGKAVAEMLGGRPIHPSTRDSGERLVMNVIEEMSIASGVPMPPVYVMDKEKGINAFAAGFRAEDAVIGVTRGCVEQLNRDEFQGVMAHEFSHILNGDMRLNIRLIGVLHGILLIGLIGGGVLRAAIYMPRGRDGKSNALPLLVIGAGLMAVGYVGTFFGTWIKSAVSRQREFLADASAVQFTRNPDGIAGALKRIGGFPTKSRVESSHAGEVSHMFFGQALSSVFATHPPLPERIKRIDPTWDGATLKQRSAGSDRRDARAAGFAGAVSGSRAAGSDGGLVAAVTARLAEESRVASQTVMESVGTLDREHVDRARELIDSLPEPVLQAARDTFAARALVLCLLADDDGSAQADQMRWLEQAGDGALVREVRRLMPVAAGLPRSVRLPVADLCIPALSGMSERQHAAFRAAVDAFARADRRVDVFEWSLSRVLSRALDGHFGRPAKSNVQYYKLLQLGEPLSVLFSTLAWVGHKDESEAREAFTNAIGTIGVRDAALLPRERCSLSALDDAIATLDHTAMPCKRELIAGMLRCVSSDDTITVFEAELTRAIADGLGCPIPPLVADEATPE
jgi:Zn-dependent protease with chaperone function